MRLAVLASPTSWYFGDLCRAAAGRHEVLAVGFGRLASRVDGRGASVWGDGVDLSAIDGVLVRTMPPGSLEQIVFRMDALGCLAAGGCPVVNPPKALETAIDKYLALARLQQAGLVVAETIACQTVEEALQAHAALGGDVVVKPLFGSLGQGMIRVSDEAVALRVYKALAQTQAVLYLQRFIPHDGCDLRLLVIGDRVLGMRRRANGDWRTNVALGASAEPFQPDAGQVETAVRAAGAVGASLAGVDLLPGRDGITYVLEVNAVPGWKALAAVHHTDVARLVLAHLESLIVDR